MRRVLLEMNYTFQSAQVSKEWTSSLWKYISPYVLGNLLFNLEFSLLANLIYLFIYLFFFVWEFLQMEFVVDQKANSQSHLEVYWKLEVIFRNFKFFWISSFFKKFWYDSSCQYITENQRPQRSDIRFFSLFKFVNPLSLYNFLSLIFSFFFKVFWQFRKQFSICANAQRNPIEIENTFLLKRVSEYFLKRAAPI